MRTLRTFSTYLLDIKSSEGLGTSIIPSDVIEKTPTSEVDPNLFVRL